MHHQSRTCCLLWLLFAVTGYMCAGAIDFQEVLSFDVPGLGGIQKFDFGDVDFDGHPEILASDGAVVILYSYQWDQVVFSFELASLAEPTNEGMYGIVLADINRDQFPDVAIGVIDRINSLDTDLRLFFFNGTGFWNQIDSFTTTFAGHVTGVTGPYGLTLFDAADFDDDRFPEFVFSFDSSAQSGLNSASVYGVTKIYHSYPDSVAYYDDRLYSDPVKFPSPYSDYTGLSSHSGSRTEFPGLWRITKTVSFQIFRDFEYSGNAALSTVAGISSSCNKTGEYSYFLPKCIGDIDTTSRSIELVASKSQTSCCYDGGTVECNSSSEISLYEFDPPDRLIKKREISPVSPSSFFFLPDSPGSFYGLTDDSVFKFDGMDASLIYSQPHNLSGRKTWKNPYEEVYPHRRYLVTTAGNTVSIYKPVLITDADGGEDHPPIPQTLKIGKPYPNPFNAAQTIPVSVKPYSHLTVTVYDLLGRKIARLFDGVVRERALELTWQAENQASGIYFIRASTEMETAVTRSILLK